MGEFQLIEWIRQQAGSDDSRTILGIGDDAAVLSVPENQELVISTDTLNTGIHFDERISATDLGYKSLAVSLSDLAAMGSNPRWVLLSISLPEINTAWIEDFIDSFVGLAKTSGVTLVGGDTCAGSLSVTVTAMGLVNPGCALTRGGARPGDLVVVSGTLGDAGKALSDLEMNRLPGESSTRALYHPVPRIALGTSLVGKASSCIDISDGLLADLGHIAKASTCAALVETSLLPTSSGLRKYPQERRWVWQLTGGEDYELCFTIAADDECQLAALEKSLDVKLTVIGQMVEGSGIRCVRPDGELFSVELDGYQHFRN